MYEEKKITEILTWKKKSSYKISAFEKNISMALSCKLLLLSLLILAVDGWMWNATCVTSKQRGRLFCIPCFSQGIDYLYLILVSFLNT